MSILAANEPAQLGGNLFLLFLMLASLAIAARAGVFRRGSIVGPQRLDPQRPIGPIVMLLIVAAVVWQMIPAFYILPLQRQAAAQGVTWSIERLAPHQLAFLAVVPPMTAFAVMLVGASIMQRDLLSRVGLSLWNFFRGLTGGLVGIIIIVPPLLAVSVVSELIYRKVGYVHPAEHELLNVLGDSVDAGEKSVAVLLIVSATIVAPLFEELLFRGLLQTILVGTGRISLRVPHLQRGDAALAPSVSETRIRWGAIFGTSLLFMAVHPIWTWPPLLFLSVGLGYAYERTGNLWTPIMIHLLFNSLSTIFYLNFAPDQATQAICALVAAPFA